MPVNRTWYAIKQSPLYKIQAKAKLAELLQFNLSDFDTITADTNYQVFQNKNQRWIQHPINELRSVHDRIQSLLTRISTPDYVHSKTGCSYITNAISHSTVHPFVKTDISKFYPSTSFSAVFNLFRIIFECSIDVAWYLAKLCCFQGKALPTGSPLSGSVAFLAHQPMFDKIAALAKSRGCVFTLFVDDLGISGLSASKALLYQVRGIIRSNGLSTADVKSKTYGTGRARKITGVLMALDGPKVPNKRQHKTYKLSKEIQSLPNGKKRDKLTKSLRGSVQEAEQIKKENVAFIDRLTSPKIGM
jgi:hypothetical protein